MCFGRDGQIRSQGRDCFSYRTKAATEDEGVHAAVEDVNCEPHSAL